MSTGTRRLSRRISAFAFLAFCWAATAVALFFLAALGFLANSGLGIYHSGVEWKLWAGPAGCSATQALPGSVGDLMKGLGQGGHIARCDDSAWRFAGLSFAGWNALISLALFAGALKAASAAVADAAVRR